MNIPLRQHPPFRLVADGGDAAAAGAGQPATAVLYRFSYQNSTE
ncbi:hypothetical protein BN439_3234 [Erwinia amylovora Ea644]|nr:hypothetical protein BN439_3234 [Erwinia amylovora Ea644]